MFVLALTMVLAASAQVKLFDASLVGGVQSTANIVDASGAWPFNTAKVFVNCGPNPTGQIEDSTNIANNFFVDNFFRITTTPAPISPAPAGPVTVKEYTCNYDSNHMGCFSNLTKSWLTPGLIGTPAMDLYLPVTPVDVKESLLAGQPQVLQVDLMDAGGINGNSQINLQTSCSIPSLVTLCHKPGTPAQQTMNNLPNAAVPGHLGHGDYVGACTTPNSKK
jgi:hypothetical protein